MLRKDACGRFCLAIAILLSLAGQFATAATADTEALLNSLPPEQRQEVIDALKERADQEGTDRTSPASQQRSQRDEQIGRDKLDRTPASRSNDRDKANKRQQNASSTSQRNQSENADEPPILVPGSTILVNGPPLKATDPTKPEANVDYIDRRILQGNPYRLDADGQLQMVGYPPMQLAGLTEAQATKRLSSEPLLQGMKLTVTLLPVAAKESESLQPFGYSVFEDAVGAFAPATNMPVPSDYLLGPGDSLRVNLVGTQNRRLLLEIDRNGEIHAPDIGAVAVAGMRFEEAKNVIEARLQEKLIGVEASITMGALRTISVFILGEVKAPGSYVVNGLSTVSNAIAVSGGVSSVGSLRRVELKRHGSTVAQLDLYDMLLHGNSRGDLRLQPGDVIFVPAVGATVGISGAVRRPAIYELEAESRGSAGADVIVQLAGGLRPDADPAMATIERIDRQGERVVLNVDLRGSSAQNFRLQAGDVVRVPTVRPTFAHQVAIEGHVHRPGAVGFVRGMRLTDALRSIDDLKPDADIHYVVIRREMAPDRKIVLLSANLAEAWHDPNGAANLELKSRDRLIVFDLNSDRQNILAPIMAELRRQSNAAENAQVATIGGRVKVPGTYPLERGMRVSDMLRAGGGLDDAALATTAELARYAIVDGDRREAQLQTIDLAAVLRGDKAADIELRPSDYLVIKEVSHWNAQETISISGEVRFPGAYPIRRGETLRSVLDRAGGYTDLANPEGSVFTRRELREREQKQLNDLAERTRKDLTNFALAASHSAASTLSNANPAPATTLGETLLGQIRSTRAVGRLVVDLHGSGGEADDASALVIKDGDALFVPPKSQEVTVIGEVRNATSHLYRPKLGRDDYVRLSGGATDDGDTDSVYVVRANGSVATGSGTAWFSRIRSDGIQAGDSIVVPLKTDRTLPLPLWQAVTTIIYNIAVAVSAIRRL